MIALTCQSSAGVDDGMIAFRRGDYAGAIQEWRPLAEAGDEQAQYYLGFVHYKGIGVSRDLSEAEKWFRMAAEQGHAFAQLSLGAIRGEAQGAPLDFQAYVWFTRAAAQAADSEGRRRALDTRGMVAASMTPEQFAEALRLVRQWQLKQHDAPEPMPAEMIEEQEPANMGPSRTPRLKSGIPETAPLSQSKPTPLEPMSIPERKPAMPTSFAVATAITGDYFVQIASLKTIDALQKEWSRQLGAFPDLLENFRYTIEEADLGSRGSFLRLQIGPFQTRSLAKDLCEQLKARRQECFVTRR